MGTGGEVVGDQGAEVVRGAENEDSHLPRHQRRFPYRPLDPDEAEEIRGEADAIIQGVEGMIIIAVSRYFPRLCKANREDIEQQIRAHIAQRVLPKYDATRPAKVSTFLHSVIRFKAAELSRNDRTRRRSNRRLRFTYGDPNEYLAELAAPDRSLDRHIEAVADDIRSHPEKYFTAKQVKVFKALVENPDKLKQDIAKSLGYRRASSFSMILRRIHEKITELSQFDASEEIGKCQ